MPDITYDAKDWPQEQRNALTAAIVSRLHVSGIEYDKIDLREGKDGSITVTISEKDAAEAAPGKEKPAVVKSPEDGKPSAIEAALVQEDVERTYQAMKTEIDLATSDRLDEERTRNQEIKFSKFRGLRLLDCDALVDEAKDEEALRALLKDFIRYVVARGV